jgi:hypothetical protein
MALRKTGLAAASRATPIVAPAAAALSAGVTLSYGATGPLQAFPDAFYAWRTSRRAPAKRHQHVMAPVRIASKA